MSLDEMKLPSQFSLYTQIYIFNNQGTLYPKGLKKYSLLKRPGREGEKLAGRANLCYRCPESCYRLTESCYRRANLLYKSRENLYKAQKFHTGRHKQVSEKLQNSSGADKPQVQTSQTLVRIQIKFVQGPKSPYRKVKKVPGE